MDLYVVAPSFEALNAKSLARHRFFTRRFKFNKKYLAAGNKKSTVWPPINAPFKVGHAKLLERIIAHLLLYSNFWAGH